LYLKKKLGWFFFLTVILNLESSGERYHTNIFSRSLQILFFYSAFHIKIYNNSCKKVFFLFFQMAYHWDIEFKFVYVLNLIKERIKKKTRANEEWFVFSIKIKLKKFKRILIVLFVCLILFWGFFFCCWTFIIKVRYWILINENKLFWTRLLNEAFIHYQSFVIAMVRFCIR
jgi:hypothetical protein